MGADRGKLRGGQGQIQVGPFTIQLSTPAAPRPRPLTVGTGDWHPSLGVLRRRVPLAALGVTDRAAWLARNPRIVGGAERAGVTYAILPAGCVPTEGCIADGVSFQIYAADGVSRIGGGRAREPTDGGVRVIAIGPVEVGIHLPDLGGGGGPD